MIPTSPLVEQTIQPIVSIDDARELGPRILPRTQWGGATSPAAGAGIHSGFVLNPGRDGLYLEQLEPTAAILCAVFISHLGGPTIWVEVAAAFGEFHSYNPANPADPPQQSGHRADGYMTTGNLPIADFPAAVPFYTLANGDAFPPRARPVFIPPTNSFCVLNFTANAAITMSIRCFDPSFLTSAR